MDPVPAHALLHQAVFVDVRERYEWAAGHPEGARHIPIGEVARRLEEIPRDRPVILVCQVGQRSALAADLLRDAGFDAHNLEGGLEAWSAAGLPLVTSTGEVGGIV